MLDAFLVDAVYKRRRFTHDWRIDRA
jgi:hypothetical protein